MPYFELQKIWQQWDAILWDSVVLILIFLKLVSMTASFRG